MIHTRSISWPIACAIGLAIISGCATDPMNNIPSNATIASSGNDHLTYTAPTYGRIWVYDVTKDAEFHERLAGMEAEVGLTGDAQRERGWAAELR